MTKIHEYYKFFIKWKYFFFSTLVHFNPENYHNVHNRKSGVSQRYSWRDCFPKHFLVLSFPSVNSLPEFTSVSPADLIDFQSRHTINFRQTFRGFEHTCALPIEQTSAKSAGNHERGAISDFGWNAIDVM